MNPTDLLEKLKAKINLKKANSAANAAKQTLAGTAPAESLWAKFKTGEAEQACLTNTTAKAVIALAVAEISQLSGGKPSSNLDAAMTPEEKAWESEKSGVPRLFYTNASAKAVLEIAAVEVAELKAGKAPTASAKPPAAAVPPVAAAKLPAAAVTPPRSPSATATVPPKAATVPGLVTATQFATPALNMERSEFGKLSPSDKARFFQEGGKLVDNPVSELAILKQQAQAAGVATKPSFEHLKGFERASAAMAWDGKRKQFFRDTAARQIHDDDMAALGTKPVATIGNTGGAAAAKDFDRESRITARAKELAAQIS
ncbi:MAG: hypothetical protein V4689_11740 [Verrucomicrobiota bacterium]